MFGVVEEDIGEGVEVLGFRCCQVAGERVGGDVDVGAGGFDESVGVQGEDGAGREGYLGGGVVGVRVDAQQQPWRHAEGVGVPVGVAEQGRGVSGRGEKRAVVGVVEVGDEAAGEQAGVEVDQEAVGGGEDLAGEAPVVA